MSPGLAVGGRRHGWNVTMTSPAVIAGGATCMSGRFSLIQAAAARLDASAPAWSMECSLSLLSGRAYGTGSARALRHESLCASKAARRPPDAVSGV